MIQRSALTISPGTLLRMLGRSIPRDTPTPRVLGVDDLALRRRHAYATILIDLETRRPVDPPKGRDAEMLAAWLRARPGVEIIVHDRAEAYADGARRGAAAVLYVADRFHLMQNVGSTMEELLKVRRRRIAVTVIEPGPPPVGQRPLSPRQQIDEQHELLAGRGCVRPAKYVITRGQRSK